jgi:hypothetical protein
MTRISVLTARVFAAGVIVVALGGVSSSQRQPTAVAPGTRVLLDAHNAYPYNGKFTDRIDRALSTGVPLAIEQDLVWRPGDSGRPGRSIVSHGEPFDDREPSLRDSFFERIRPLVEHALRDDNRRTWPLIILNLDLKSNDPEHLRALWTLLGEYEGWLTTAERIRDGSQSAPLDVKPVLVLTGSSDAQAAAFSDAVPIGAKLRLFGAIVLRPPAAKGTDAATAQRLFWESLPTTPLPRATNYRRWWNAPWSVVEAGGQRNAGEWTREDDTRLRTLVRYAHDAGLWIRLWTLNGHPDGEEKASGWSTGYNFGSIEAARARWRAAISAGADFVATDQYEAFSEVRSAGVR